MIYKLSDYIPKHQTFVLRASELFALTDFISEMHPNYLEWYWGKTIPRVLNKRGEIFFEEVNHEVIGILIAKKTTKQRKICTFWVNEKFRKKGVGGRLLKRAIEYLETDKPLISIPENEVSSFEKIIENYHWTLVQTLEPDEYSTVREYLYNGKYYK